MFYPDNESMLYAYEHGAGRAGKSSYHHENHTDRAYNLSDAADILDRLSEFEETDSGLWEGQEPRDAISAQAAYTYANAVYSEWRDLIEQLEEELEDLARAIEDTVAPEAIDDDTPTLEELVNDAGARYLRLYFALHDLDGEDGNAFGGMVKAAREAANVGEWGAALALSDRIKEEAEGKGEREESRAEYKAQAIRDAVK